MVVYPPCQTGTDPSTPRSSTAEARAVRRVHFSTFAVRSNISSPSYRTDKNHAASYLPRASRCRPPRQPQVGAHARQRRREGRAIGGNRGHHRRPRRGVRVELRTVRHEAARPRGAQPHEAGDVSLSDAALLIVSCEPFVLTAVFLALTGRNSFRRTVSPVGALGGCRLYFQRVAIISCRI